MSDSKLLPSWLTFTLTSGLFLIGDQQGVRAKSIDIVDSSPSTINQTNNRLGTKLLPQIISQTNLPNPIPPRTPAPPIQSPQPQPKPPVELDPAPSPIILNPIYKLCKQQVFFSQ